MTSHVEQQIQRRIEAARRKAEQDKQQRAELAEARRHGLAKRHAAKMRATAPLRPVPDSPAAPGSVCEVIAYAVDDWLERTAPATPEGGTWCTADIAEHVMRVLAQSGYRVTAAGGGDAA